MVALHTPEVQNGWKANEFNLKGVDGNRYTLADVKGEKGLLVMFICNHCPFVKAIVDRVVRDAKALQEKGVGVVAIMANDTEDYPEDSFENMQLFAEHNGFTFPYVIDETQEIAKAYGAVCTPDFFGFDAQLGLQYRGRLDASGMSPAAADAKRELYEALCLIAETGKAPPDQNASIGCSIKWKE